MQLSSYGLHAGSGLGLSLLMYAMASAHSLILNHFFAIGSRVAMHIKVSFVSYGAYDHSALTTL